MSNEQNGTKLEMKAFWVILKLIIDLQANLFMLVFVLHIYSKNTLRVFLDIDSLDYLNTIK